MLERGHLRAMGGGIGERILLWTPERQGGPGGRIDEGVSGKLALYDVKSCLDAFLGEHDGEIVQIAQQVKINLLQMV